MFGNHLSRSGNDKSSRNGSAESGSKGAYSHGNHRLIELRKVQKVYSTAVVVFSALASFWPPRNASRVRVREVLAYE